MTLLTIARQLLATKPTPTRRLPADHPVRVLERRVRQCARLTQRLRRSTSALEDALLATYRETTRHDRTSA
jgi:hypothetical protein